MNAAASMALTALVLGTATAVASTGRVTPALVISGSVAWSFVPLVQLFTGLVLVRGAAMSRGEALARYFAAHTAWSLWVLAAAVFAVLVSNPLAWLFTVVLTAAVPMVLTARQLVRLCRTDFGLAADLARRRVAVHQALTVAVILVYGEYAGGLVRRLVELFR